MFTVNDEAVGPHQPGRASPDRDHERLVLEARDVAFDWATLPFHYVPGEPFTTHMLNVLHLLLPAGEEFFVDVFKQAFPLIKDDQLRLDVQGFIGQEAMHAQAHTGVQEYFAANDIDVTPFTDQMTWLFAKLLGDRPRWSVRRQRSWLLERVAVVVGNRALHRDSGRMDPQHPGARRDRHRPGDAGHAPVARRRRSRTQGCGLRPDEAPAGRLLATGPHPTGRDADDAADVGARSSVHVLVDGRCRRSQAVPAGLLRCARRGVMPGPLRFIRVIRLLPAPLPSLAVGGVEKAVDYLAISPAARASH